MPDRNKVLECSRACAFDCVGITVPGGTYDGPCGLTFGCGGVEVNYDGCSDDYIELFELALCLLKDNFDIVSDWWAVTTDECHDKAGLVPVTAIYEYLNGDRKLQICCGAVADALCYTIDPPYAITMADRGDWVLALGGAMLFGPAAGALFYTGDCIYFCDPYMDFLVERYRAAKEEAEVDPDKCSDVLCLVLDLAAVLLHELVHYYSRFFSTWTDEALAWSVEGYFREQMQLRYGISSDYCCSKTFEVCYHRWTDATFETSNECMGVGVHNR